MEAPYVSDHPIPQRREDASQVSVSGSSHIGAHRQNDPATEGKAMSAAAPEKCPWCSEVRDPLMGAGDVRYKCGSMTHEGGLFQQHPACEASVLRKRVEELEEQLAFAHAALESAERREN